MKAIIKSFSLAIIDYRLFSTHISVDSKIITLLKNLILIGGR